MSYSVPETKIFKGFTINGHVSRLGHVTWTQFGPEFVQLFYPLIVMRITAHAHMNDLSTINLVLS